MTPDPGADDHAVFGLTFFPLAGFRPLSTILMSECSTCGGAGFQYQHSGNQKLVDIEFKANLVFIASSKPSKAIL